MKDLKSCKNCGLPLVRGTNCKSLLANYRDRPECQQIRMQKVKEQRLAASKRQSKRLHEDRFCQHCKVKLVTGKNVKSNAAKWCDRPECQEAKKLFGQERRKHYAKELCYRVEPDKDSNWQEYTTGQCEFCGEFQTLNRFKICHSCYSYRSHAFETQQFETSLASLNF